MKRGKKAAQRPAAALRKKAIVGARPPGRRDGRGADELRPVAFRRNILAHLPGSVLAAFGKTQVLCTVCVEEGVPDFLRGKGTGWLTSEYGMLPGSTNRRKPRDRSGKVDGRTVEIQRLIGRALRQAVDLGALGERTLWIDCDVLQADGGTRTASITGAWVALSDAQDRLIREGKLFKKFVSQQVAAVSVGIVGGRARLDLDYSEDSQAGTDMNLVMTSRGQFVEIQGTAEHGAFSEKQLGEMLKLGRKGMERLFELQLVSGKGKEKG
ncbi:MAG: ribonuclease [Planctomycetota bacterium]|nr:MAG: ribonuclease [Planctomycetota bacterium]